MGADRRLDEAAAQDPVGILRRIEHAGLAGGDAVFRLVEGHHGAGHGRGHRLGGGADPGQHGPAFRRGSVQPVDLLQGHGRGAQGFAGYPNLNDDDWIWGGSIEDIHKTISFGVRSEHQDTRASEMPKFGVDKLLEPAQISDTAEYVLSLSKKSSDAAAAGRGAKLYADNCAACHGETGEGNKELGAPNLSDAIWLYGNRKEDVVMSIATGRGGKMPGWAGRLDDVTVKALAVYVHNLGGGK